MNCDEQRALLEDQSEPEGDQTIDEPQEYEDQENEEYLDEYLDEQHLEEGDEGYSSGADQEVRDVASPSNQAQFVCGSCHRSCKGKRGLAIHSASCLKKHRAN